MADKYSTTPRKRRRRPYGRVFRRPGGPGWLVQFLDPSGRKAPSGRTAYVTRSFETKAEGEALLREIRKEILKGTLALPAAEPEISDITVLEAVDGHLGALRAKGGAESTIALYGYSKKPLAAQGLGHMKVSDVKVRDVERYLAWRRTHTWRPRPRSPGGKVEAEPAKGAVASASTIARDRELLCAAFNRLVRNGQLSKNVVSKVPKPRKKAKKRVVLSKAEVRNLIAACGKCLRLVVLALVYTGARKGEILALRWRDLCFESMTISLYRPKVSNFSRIPLHPVLAEELRAVKQRLKEARLEAVPSDEHVFLNRYGRRYRCFKKAWAFAVRRAGLKDRDVTPHCLRHAFACHFLEGGASVTDLQAVLGHSSLATTQIYASMVDRRTRESVEALDFS